ncbi:hypothetical protein F5B22DRAFT_660566 [Xylaria bambusicola]|uniref:uncharacterized protein n=1 Tax=Xylaria bambusicola TaxID=326684 RepID=UPI002008228A|nr:uncharacterized protein F5B22DRAFT_660566 [Xylaria bambusicola]KAI0522192.1 hypothetical protein F5B22DRAFT_660566 [Xylaria bambusicola]
MDVARFVMRLQPKTPLTSRNRAPFKMTEASIMNRVKGAEVNKADSNSIRECFWGSGGDAKNLQSTTFRDSKDRPGHLSHMVLSANHHVHWVPDCVVFDSLRLNLLPEYVEKKAERGEWFTEEKIQMNDGAAVKPVQDGLTEDNKDTLIRATPNSTPPNTKTTSHLKHTDSGTEVIQFTSAPHQPPKSEEDSRAEYTDTRVYSESSSSESQFNFPTIAPIDYVPANALPIAVFESRLLRRSHASRKQASKRGEKPMYLFKGWFKVSRVNILAPHSAELVSMLKYTWERKYSHRKQPKAFDLSAHREYLAREWAAVRFEVF